MAKKIGKLANRYARALLRVVQDEVAGQNDEVRRYGEKLSEVASFWQTHPEVSSSLLSPMFPLEERRKALCELVKQVALPPTLNRFLEVLLTRDRLSAIVEIANAFREIADEACNIVHVRVTTASTVEGDEKSKLQQDIKRLVDGNPTYSWHTDDRILGGVVVEFGGMVVDASLRGQIEKLEGRLLGEI